MSTQTKPQKSSAQKIGCYLKYQREKRDLSLNELAQKSELTASFLFRLEKGEYQSVKLDVIEKLTKALDMSVTEFLEKCDITNSQLDLPSLPHYLKEKFQFPPEAISDCEIMIEVLQKKYQKEIQQQKKQHKKYWKKNKQINS